MRSILPPAPQRRPRLSGPPGSSRTKTWVRVSSHPMLCLEFRQLLRPPRCTSGRAPGPSATLSVHLPGACVAQGGPDGIPPRPRTGPFISAQEILDLLCHSITLVLFVAALIRWLRASRVPASPADEPGAARRSSAGLGAVPVCCCDLAPR